MIRQAAAALAVVVAFAGPSRAGAQSASSSLEDVRERRIPAPEEIKEQMDNARFTLGPVRILPRLEISDLGYTSNVFGTAENPEPDETARVATGIRAILPVGRKVFFAADALPEYFYYRRHSELRHFGGRYGGQILGLFNRLRLDLNGSTENTREDLSSEVLVPVTRRTDSGWANVEIEFLKRFGLVLSYGEDRVRYLTDAGGTSASDLDRTGRTARAGVRYHFADRISLTAFVEEARADFVPEGTVRNNQSRAYLLGVHYDRTRFYIDLTGGYRKVEPRAGGDFPVSSGPSGSFFSSYTMTSGWVGAVLYAHRGINYSVYESLVYYQEEVLGGGPEVHVGKNILVSLFGETGRNLYPSPVIVSGQSVDRVDQIQSWGGQVSFLVSSTLNVAVRAAESRYNSNVPGFNRNIFRVTSTVSLNGDTSR